MFFSLSIPKFMFLDGKKRGLFMTILYIKNSLISKKYKNFYVLKQLKIFIFLEYFTCKAI